MSSLEKPHKLSKQLRARAQEFLSDPGRTDILLEIVREFECGADQHSYLLTLEMVFTSLLRDRQMYIEVVPLKPVERSPENRCKEWLKNVYEECFVKILDRIESSSHKIQMQGLATAVNILAHEGRYPLEQKGTFDNFVPLLKLKYILMKILSDKKNNTQLINKYTEYLLYDDILFFTWKVLPSITAKSNPNDVYIMNYLLLLEKLQVDKNCETKALCGTEGSSFFIFEEHLTIRSLNKVWHCVMLWDHTPQTHKQLLIVLLERVLTHLEKPLLLTDFLMDSLDVGGPVSLLALQGIFTMIQAHNLNYPNIFGKLYSMFEPEIFHTKYKARLFYLSHLFLSSTHLPESLVAAFAKRLARLALVAPSEDITIICNFIGNLILSLHQQDTEYLEEVTGRCQKLKQKWQSWVLISSANPLCAMYFRSEKGIRLEKRRQLDSEHPYMIHPLSKFRAWYEVYLCVLYLWALLEKPVDAAFAVKAAVMFPGHRQISLILDLLLFVDIVVHFFTGYIISDRKTIEMRTGRIARHYLLGPYFVCDLLSNVPRNIWYFVFKDPWKDSTRWILGVNNILMMFKLPRLISLVKLATRVSLYFNVKSTGALFLTLSFLVFSVIVHWCACLQFLVPRLTGRYFVKKMVKKSWIFQYGIFESSIFVKYLHGMFRASAYILGVRLLNIYDLTLAEEYVLAVIMYCIGKVLVGFMWIILAVFILNSRSKTIKYHQMMRQLDEYLMHKRLPEGLRRRVHEFYALKYQGKYFNEGLISNLLPETVTREIRLHSCQTMIKNMRLFSQMTHQEITTVITRLHHELFMPTEVIIESGTRGDAMYFLSSGTVAVYTHSGKEVCHLQDGAFFGEVSLILKGQTRATTVIALEATEVYKLAKNDVERLLLRNKNVYKKLLFLAEQRLQTTIQIEETYKRKMFEETLRSAKSF